MGVKDLSLSSEISNQDLTNTKATICGGKKKFTKFSNSNPSLYHLKRKEIKLPYLRTDPGTERTPTATPLKKGGVKPADSTQHPYLEVSRPASKALLRTKDERNSYIQREGHLTLRRAATKKSKNDHLHLQPRISRSALPEKPPRNCEHSQVYLPPLVRQDGFMAGKGRISSKFATSGSEICNQPISAVARGRDSSFKKIPSSSSCEQNSTESSYSDRNNPLAVPKLLLSNKIFNPNGNDHCSVINLTIPLLAPVQQDIYKLHSCDQQESTEEEAKFKSTRRRSSNATGIPTRRKSTKCTRCDVWENKEETLACSQQDSKELKLSCWSDHSKLLLL